MADSHPYISGPGNISQMIEHLRKNFPATITSDTVKKLGIAPNNESYVINALQFIGVIGEDGKKTEAAKAAFSSHKAEDFAAAFEDLVKSAYSDLFDLHGEKTWTLDKDELITFFRQSDDTSATIGGRQASTFQVFASLAGHGEGPASRPKGTSAPKKKALEGTVAAPKAASTPQTRTGQLPQQNLSTKNPHDVGLTVRIEINLPAGDKKETYDSIFKSIRENLING